MNSTDNLRLDSPLAAEQAMPATVTLGRQREQRSLWWDAFRRLTHDKAAMVGLVIVFALCVIAIFAPLLAPSSPTDQSFIQKLKPPSSAHWMGTDEFGRD